MIIRPTIPLSSKLNNIDHNLKPTSTPNASQSTKNAALRITNEILIDFLLARPTSSPFPFQTHNSRFRGREILVSFDVIAPASEATVAPSTKVPKSNRWYIRVITRKRVIQRRAAAHPYAIHARLRYNFQGGKTRHAPLRGGSVTQSEERGALSYDAVQIIWHVSRGISFAIFPRFPLALHASRFVPPPAPLFARVGIRTGDVPSESDF